jgi:hypothetical protein
MKVLTPAKTSSLTLLLSRSIPIKAPRAKARRIFWSSKMLSMKKNLAFEFIKLKFMMESFLDCLF